MQPVHNLHKLLAVDFFWNRWRKGYVIQLFNPGCNGKWQL